MRKLPYYCQVALVATCLMVLAGCNSTPPAPVTNPKVLSSVDISPKTAALFNGPAGASCSIGAQQLKATATYSDGTTADVSSSASWTSADATIAQVSASGLASGTGGKAGSTTIKATLNGVAGTSSVTVSYISQAGVSPVNPVMANTSGNTKQFSLTGTLVNADASTAKTDLTKMAAWSVPGGTVSGAFDANTVASVGTATGLIAPVAAGSTQVTAGVCGVNAQTSLYVVSSGAVALSTNSAASMSYGSTQTLTASELYVDGSSDPIQANVTWASSTSAVQLIPYGPNNSSVIVYAPTTATSAAVATMAARNYAGVDAIQAATALSVPVTITATVTLPSGGNVYGATSLTVQPALARFAISSGGSGAPTATYATSSGVLTPVWKTFQNSLSGWRVAGQLLLHPSGNFMYTADGYDGAIVLFQVDPVTGSVTVSPNQQPIFINNDLVLRGALDPTGQYLYVVSDLGSQILGYSISQNAAGPNAGALTPIPGTTTAVNAPVDIKMDPAGRSVYVLNSGGNTVSSFNIGAGGILTASSNAPFALKGTPTGAAIDPSGAYLYVLEGSSEVEVLSTATLSKLAGSPYTIPGYSSISSAVVDPSGAYLYLLDSPPYTAAPTSPSGHALVLTLNSGALASTTPISSAPVGIGPQGIAVDPGGTQLIVENSGSNTLNAFAILNGVLTSASTVEAPGYPSDVTMFTAPATATVEPTEVFATNSASGTLAAFSVGSGGALTPDSKSPITTDVANATSLVAASASGVIMTAQGTCKITFTPFVDLCNGTQVGAYQFNPNGTTATVSPMSGFPYNAGEPVVSLAADNSGLIVYAPGSSDSLTFFLDPSTNLLALPPRLASRSYLLQSLGELTDPEGILVFDLEEQLVAPGDVFVEPQVGDTPLGSSSFGTQEYIASTQISSAAISADGLNMVALDPTEKLLYGYALTSPDLILGAVPQEGTALTLTGSPNSVVFDPRGRYVLVTDPAAGTITAYAFNPAGTPTPFAGAGTAIALPSGKGSAGKPVFDATGAYLFVPLAGTPSGAAAVAGSIAVYTVSVTGQSPSFTAVAGSPFPAGTTTTGLGTSVVAVINNVK